MVQIQNLTTDIKELYSALKKGFPTVQVAAIGDAIVITGTRNPTARLEVGDFLVCFLDTFKAMTQEQVEAFL